MFEFAKKRNFATGIPAYQHRHIYRLFSISFEDLRPAIRDVASKPNLETDFLPDV